MKRMLLILNGTHVANYLLVSAATIAQATSSAIHALFLNNDPHWREENYFFPNDLSLAQNTVTGRSLKEEDNEMMAANSRLLQDECALRNIHCELEVKNNLHLNALVKYSGFFDVILVDARANLYAYQLPDLLSKMHCPVIIISGPLDNIDRIIFAYDGSDSSIYAIKMFTYLFPAWKTKPVDLVFATEEVRSEMPFREEMASWLSAHYHTVDIHVLPDRKAEALSRFVRLKEVPCLLVMGAYGKKGLPQLFHKSLSMELMRRTDATFFISHH